MEIWSMKLSKLALIILVTLLIVACGKGKYASMSNSDLKAKMHHCDGIPKKTAVFANGCEKISDEIKRRRKKRNES